MKYIALSLFFFASFVQASSLTENLASSVEKYSESPHINGASVLIHHQKKGEIFRAVFGYQGAKGSREIQRDTIFDLASMTKLFTAAAVMKLHQDGVLNVGEKFQKYIPSFEGPRKDKVTVADMLSHQSGVAAVNYLSDFVDGDLEKTWENIIGIKMVREPRSSFVYSDVGYLLLGRLIEASTSSRIDQYVSKAIFKTLALENTFYTVPKKELYRVVETDPAKPVGEVHDPRSARLKNQAGHAGIFSTIDDVLKFSQIYRGTSFFNHETLSYLLKPNKFGRGLGPDISSKYSGSVRGSYMPKGKSFGHTGYTGTSLWMDKDSGVTIIVLSNRVYPNDSGDSKRAISAFRRELADIIGKHYYPTQGANRQE